MARDLFQRVERLAGDDARRGHARNRHRIDLLEMIERLGNDGGFELGDGRKRRQGAVRRLDVIIQDLIRIQSKPLGDLRNDFVRTAGEPEILRIAAAQRGGERAADVDHSQAELRGLFAVDDKRQLRLINLEIGVEEHELSRRQSFRQEFAGDAVHLLERVGALEDELNRQARRAGERRRLEGDEAHARNGAQLLLEHMLQVLRADLALIRGLEHDAGQIRRRRIDLEHAVGLWMLGDDLICLIGVVQLLLESGVGRPESPAPE